MIMADTHQEYLQSDQWKTLRIRALNRAGHRCQVCNNPDGLEVHHRTYERVGHEQLDDLTVLCERCHNLISEYTKDNVSALPLESALREMGEAVEAQISDKASSPSALSTGFLDLDGITAGLKEGEVFIVAAPSGVGKSAFVLNLARHIAVEGKHPILFASLEYSRFQVAQHLMSAQARVDGQRIRRGRLNPDDLERLAQAEVSLSSAKLFIDDSARQNMLHIVASARRFHKEQAIRAVFVDCLDLVEPENSREFRQEQMAVMSRRLKRLAKELQIPVIATARLARGTDDRSDYRPRLSDFRQNWAVEQEADTVMMLHQPDPEPGRRGETIDVIIAKNRNGPTNTITLTFLKRIMRFENFAWDSPFDGE